MTWKVSFFDQRVQKSIQTWHPKLIAGFLQIVQLIETEGPRKIGMPIIRCMGNGLFEIRVKSSVGIARAMFSIHDPNNIMILDAFIKKTQKTPLRNLAIATKRLKQIKNAKKTIL